MLKMTIKEAMQTGVRFIRKPDWPTAKIELPQPTSYGTYPWFKLHSNGQVQELIWLSAETDADTDWVPVPG